MTIFYKQNLIETYCIGVDYRLIHDNNLSIDIDVWDERIFDKLAMDYIALDILKRGIRDKLDKLLNGDINISYEFKRNYKMNEWEHELKFYTNEEILLFDDIYSEESKAIYLTALNKMFIELVDSFLLEQGYKEYEKITSIALEKLDKEVAERYKNCELEIAFSVLTEKEIETQNEYI